MLSKNVHPLNRKDPSLLCPAWQRRVLTAGRGAAEVEPLQSEGKGKGKKKEKRRKGKKKEKRGKGEREKKEKRRKGEEKVQMFCNPGNKARMEAGTGLAGAKQEQHTSGHL